jgi:flavin reductase (DIM6/NTAB) family NADH-FMN oxidoreductase RutF
MLKTEITAEQKEQFGRAMGRMASGVYIVTVDNEGKRDGMLATWVMQASMDPPVVSVAVKDGRPILSALKEGSHFVVNVLSKTNMDVFKNFAKPDLNGEDRFTGLKCGQVENNLPYFEEAVSYFTVKVIKHTTAGDHVIVFGEVVGGAMLNEGGEPMVHLRKSGFQY